MLSNAVLMLNIFKGVFLVYYGTITSIIIKGEGLAVSRGKRGYASQ